MSADSQCPSKTQNRSSTEPNTVSPQEVIETTILDNVKSVAGFIQDVVPNSATLDNRDQIQWIRFEHQNNDEYEFDADADRISLRPLLLLVGYPTGVQIWSIPYSGEAVEIYSQRHKNIKAAKILPTPFKVGGSDVDAFEKERPMIAQYDDIITSETQSFNLNIYSMKTNNKVRNIPFGRPIVDVFANRTSLVVTFNDRIAVFDAFTLGDKIVVTTCYPSPGLNPCPIALGSRWLAYAENKLMPQRRSNGGYEGEGVQSVTATVLHAAKTIGKGLLDFTGSVTNSLTGTTPAKPLSNLSSSPGSSDPQKGIITVIDLENPDTVTKQRTVDIEGVVCHFQAHKDAISAMSFDPSGMLLLTADRRGNDFHVFRIHPHPQGPSQAAVHHLYILHRGDTSAKVQDVCFSPDTRWVTVSTHRGTTHVFPVTPYGGPVVSRTHCWDNVVNKMSRFHRSAGLTAEGRSNSPTVLPNEVPVNQHFPFHNPRLPPFPTPTVINPYNQIRQPYIAQNSGSAQQRTSSGRQRSTSTSEDSTQQQVLRVAACFAKPRAWIANGSSKFEANQGKQLARAIEALFVMSVHGTLIEYDLEPKTNVPKSQAYDDSPFQLVVRPKAQWILQRQPNTRDVLTLSGEGLNNVHLEVAPLRPDGNDEQWVPQVEIHTHVGPHRRLWMGPQFSFKTYTTSVGPLSNFNILESKPIDLGKGRSNPVNVPGTDAVASIESGSLSSTEPSPKYNDSLDRVFMEFGSNEMQLQFALEEAMKEHKEEDGKEGRRCVIVSMKPASGIAKVVNPLGTVITVHSDDDDIEPIVHEEIIHENCDEALFRPIVASRAIVFEPKNIQTKGSYTSVPIEHIFSKNVDGNVKYPANIAYSSFSPSNVTSMITKASDLKPSRIQDILTVQSHKKTPQVDLISKINNLESKKFDFNLKQEKRIDKCDSFSEVDSGIEKERSESPLHCDNKFKSSQGKSEPSFIESSNPSRKTKPNICDISDFSLKLNQIEEGGPVSFSDEGLICLKSPEIEVLDDPNEPRQRETREVDEKKQKDRRLKHEKYQGLEQKDIISSSEENATEEKILPKKPRKPKTKLGVRISNVNKENADDVTVDFNISLPKRSWSNVAASKPQTKDRSPDLTAAPKANFDEFDVIGGGNRETDAFVGKFTENLIKVDKSSDEEKIGTSSSQTETTESDDSPIDAVAMDTEEDNCAPDVKMTSTVAKASKKKSKKKKR